MSDAISAHGTLLKKGNAASPEVFTTVAEVLDIEGPALEREEYDTTNHGSTNWEETLPGLKKGGEVTFEINYLPTNATHKNASGGLLYDWAQGTSANWQLVVPSSPTATFAFAAWVKSFQPKEPVADKLSASVTLRLTGAVTLP